MDPANPIAQLSEAEVAALRGAATWYANYHASEVAELAGVGAAYAVEERRRYMELVAALEKLGARVRVPDSLIDAGARAA